MRVIVRGGAGFIGCAVCRDLIRRGGFDVLNINKLIYAGNLASLQPLEDADNYRFIKADICDAEAMWEAFEGFRPDCVMHLAAESHVDRSITGAREFIDTNVTGTFMLLEAARRYWMGLGLHQAEAFCFLRLSTDEVCGSLGETRRFAETKHMVRVRLIRRRKPRRIISQAPGSGPTSCRS